MYTMTWPGQRLTRDCMDTMPSKTQCHITMGILGRERRQRSTGILWARWPDRWTVKSEDQMDTTGFQYGAPGQIGTCCRAGLVTCDGAPCRLGRVVALAYGLVTCDGAPGQIGACCRAGLVPCDGAPQVTRVYVGASQRHPQVLARYYSARGPCRGAWVSLRRHNVQAGDPGDL